ncbi:MAG TPA: LytTR family DNA-binding domain-containing protein, partial [Flavipsychrobacter sp.]
HTPDLVFLDIHMPGENAFEFLHRIGSFSFEIVFVTAFDDYAINAFKLNAVDYILKPVYVAEVEAALQKAKEKLLHKKITLKDSAFFSRILQQVYNKQSLDQFSFRDNGTVHVVPFKDIIYIEAMGSYTRVFYRIDNREKTFTMSHSLSEYEQLLPGELFYRIHKSYLVNRMHVLNVSKSGTPATLLSDSRMLPVGRRRLAGFLSFLNGSMLI